MVNVWFAKEWTLSKATTAFSGAIAIPELGVRVHPVFLGVSLHTCMSLLLLCFATSERTPEHTSEGRTYATAFTHHYPLDQDMHLPGLKQLKELSNHVRATFSEAVAASGDPEDAILLG